jgi:hypothetical protein
MDVDQYVVVIDGVGQFLRPSRICVCIYIYEDGYDVRWGHMLLACDPPASDILLVVVTVPPSGAHRTPAYRQHTPPITRHVVATIVVVAGDRPRRGRVGVPARGGGAVVAAAARGWSGTRPTLYLIFSASSSKVLDFIPIPDQLCIR